jgi:hypothetical protein
VYIKELWGINPINPATTEVELLWRGVLSAQSSTLALTSCLLMSSGTQLPRHCTCCQPTTTTTNQQFDPTNSELSDGPLAACQTLFSHGTNYGALLYRRSFDTHTLIHMLRVCRRVRVQARHHLGVLFDTADYDIACVLLPLSWWSRLYAENHDEGPYSSPPSALSPLASYRGCVGSPCRPCAGMDKQVYYVTLGQQICENCGAQNDDTYRNLT